MDGIAIRNDRTLAGEDTFFVFFGNVKYPEVHLIKALVLETLKQSLFIKQALPLLIDRLLWELDRGNLCSLQRFNKRQQGKRRLDGLIA